MEQVEDTWSIPANLRWLAEQSDRPGYVPCGELTGRFLNLTADRFEALATRTTDQAKEEEIARAVQAERDRCLAAVDRLKGCEVRFGDRSRFSIAEMNVQHRRTCRAIREEITGEAVWHSMEAE